MKEDDELEQIRFISVPACFCISPEMFNRILTRAFHYSQTTLLFIQDSKKTRNNSSTESINHSLRLRLT
ncbi:MAG: hypothetical protein E7K63_09175, partial [Acinetobacter baumannii]|nr:hypothetical protein [Acinetobacter baumannii]